MNRRMPEKSCLGTATSAIWKATQRPWLMTFAPILISFSLKLVSDKSLIGAGVVKVRRTSSNLKLTAASGPCQT